VVLPATTFFEHKDLQTAYGHYYVQISNAAIAPSGEAKSNVEMFRQLALRMGFAEACFRETEDQMIDTALASGAEVLQGIDRERLEREYSVRLNLSSASGLLCCSAVSAVASATHTASVQSQALGNSRTEKISVDQGESAADRSFSGTRKSELGADFYLPFANGFATPSGKAELYSEALAAQGLDPVASFIPPVESRHVAGRYPLEMLARKADNFLNSTFVNLPALQAMEEQDLLEISRADASARSIREGDRVRVFNGRGSIELTARVDGKVQPGVVAARLGWAKLTPKGQNINVLTSERLTDIGAGATFYSCMVEVERVS
jgi:anaerobic selenocysteine-containing dehydrogenase